MRLTVETRIDYGFTGPSDALLQLEVAALPDQLVEHAHLDISACEHVSRVAAHDTVGERVWLRVADRLTVEYRATIAVQRVVEDCTPLRRVPPHLLPGDAVQYLMASRYCQSDQFQNFVDAEFPGIDGGARVTAIRDWINANFRYVPGVSTSDTTAIDSFVKRQGICRDYAHVLIALVRACGIPARIASVYALGVVPQDFHAVAEVFLDGEWHLVDATGMARAGATAKIGIGRDAADVAFLTTYGNAWLIDQSIAVRAA